MNAQLLPFIYATLVFSVVAFLFILLGRIFLNVETIYYYEFEILTTVHDDLLLELQRLIKRRGQNGWKHVGVEYGEIEGAKGKMMMLTFEKSKNKIKFF